MSHMRILSIWLFFFFEVEEIDEQAAQTKGPYSQIQRGRKFAKYATSAAFHLV